jgi:hypothetical protein
MPKVTIEARRLFRFAEVIGERRLITATVGPDLTPILLSLEGEPDYQIEASPDQPRFPKKRADRPNNFRIHHRVAEDVWTELDLPETVENYHAVQPLRDEEWLLVRGRSEGDRDENAHVYDAFGRLLRSFPAGDGVQDVQSTRGGDIWISYFDEGIFGDTKLGQAGLARLDRSGVCSFEFNDQPVGVWEISDCYALNVASDREVWLCYYTDFPLVRLMDGKVDAAWTEGPVKGSPAFAVRADRTLFAGGYEERDKLVLTRLGDRAGVKLTVTDEAGLRLKGFRTFARRDRLFLQTEDTLHVVEVPNWSLAG